MRLTAKEYAQRSGLNPRTVRLKLASGDLPGFKGTDPITGSPTWFVEVPDSAGDPGGDPAGMSGMCDPTTRIEVADHLDLASGQLDPASRMAHANQEDHPPGSGWISFDQHQSIVDRYHRENLELAGRIGFLQNEVVRLGESNRLLEAKLALLEAPKIEPTPTPAAKPWWKFW
jgi:hypothetical protein